MDDSMKRNIIFDICLLIKAISLCKTIIKVMYIGAESICNKWNYSQTIFSKDTSFYQAFPSCPSYFSVNVNYSGFYSLQKFYIYINKHSIKCLAHNFLKDVHLYIIQYTYA